MNNEQTKNFSSGRRTEPTKNIFLSNIVKTTEVKPEQSDENKQKKVEFVRQDALRKPFNIQNRNPRRKPQQKTNVNQAQVNNGAAGEGNQNSDRNSSGSEIKIANINTQVKQNRQNASNIQNRQKTQNRQNTSNIQNKNPRRKPQQPRYQLLEPEKPIQKVNIDATQLPDENLTSGVQGRLKNALKVVFLGGVGEIGKNMMALEFNRDIIVVDCGSTFPYGDSMPGIDLVVPEITYLTQNKDRIKGIVITHGHEDHIGAIPYVLSDLEVPVYGSRLTLALIENKLREFPKIKAKLISIKAKEVIKLGQFTVEFINVNHSIAGSMALAITTAAGVMVHTGDFKIDFSPIGGDTTDLGRFAELGKQGVMLLTAESTNIERDGYSMSERTVGETMDELFERFSGQRIFVATFASNIHRLQQLLSLAEKYGRHVTFTGRSMVNVSETAYKIGELKFNPKNFIELDNIAKYPDKELLVISTGSQGEPMSALTRMASGEFQKIKLGENDAVIISASPIPGNEKSVNNVINQLYKLGCEVIYNDLEAVHVSGHACKEELKIIHSLIKPKFFIPVHGEYRHLKLHKDLAITMGMEARNIALAEIGSVFEVNQRGIRFAGSVPAGNRLVDGLGLGDIESIVLRDRKQLSEDGLAVVVLGMSAATGEITTGPDIISRGLIYSNEMEKLIYEGRQVIIDTIKEIPIKQMDWNLVKNNVKRALGNFFYKKTKRRPMVLTIVLEN